MKPWFFFFLILLGFCSCGKMMEAYQSMPVCLEYLRDPSHLVGKDQVHLSEFEKVPNAKFRNGTNGGLYWFRVRCVTSGKNDQTFVFELEDLLYEPVQFWEVKNNQLVGISDQASQYTKVDSHRALLRRLKPGENTFYFSVNFRRHASVTVKAFPEDQYLYKMRMALLDMGLYYGIVFMALVVNLVCFVLFRDVLFLLYSASLLSITLLFTFYDGLLGGFVSSAWLLNYGDVLICMSLTFIGGYCFARNYLTIENFFPQSKYIELTNASVTCITFFCFLLTDLTWLYALGCLLMYYSLGYYVVVSLRLIPRYTYAKFFFAGYVLLLLGAMFYVLPLVFGIEQRWLSVNMVRLGGLAEMILLMSAIIYRARKLDREVERMKTEIQESFAPTGEREKQMLSDEDLRSTYELTKREIEVLHAILQGLTNQEISTTLFISKNTVKFHTSNIYRKLDVTSRTKVIQLLST